MNDSRIFDISTEDEFHNLALEIFRYQYDRTKVYREFCDHLRTAPNSVNSIEQIPFLPIEFFKSRKVLAESMDAALHFKSSGTTGAVTSSHYVADPELYRHSFNLGFRKFFGPADQYCILALLPSYLERQDSSLVYMVKDLIGQSPFDESGFYLSELDILARHLKQLNESGIKVILFGVTFALLELAHHFKIPLRNTVVIETGGMKGRRKEMVREEVHKILKEAWGLKSIHSEYGMTELLSQAYSKGEGNFHTPEWMRISIRDPEDPLKQVGTGVTGGINVIDLANIHSCSFIATQDLGKLHKNRGFEVLGRFDHSDIRGCNLMVI